MPGARCARSLACEIKKAHEYSHHGHAGNRPAFPAQWFYGLLRALPGVRILGCHRHRRIMVCQSPVGVTRLRKFSTSNGCQDHTTSPSASAPSVSAPDFAHGVDPALLIPCAPDAAASTASRPAFVTTRDPPLCVERDGEGYRSDLGQPRTEIFLQMGLDGISLICPSGTFIERKEGWQAVSPGRGLINPQPAIGRFGRYAPESGPITLTLSFVGP